jgi:hypothetical protein
MTPERWQQIRDVLEKAQELEPTQRSAFLDRACSSDRSLRQEVEALLACSDEARSSFLQSAPLADEFIAKLEGISGVGLQGLDEQTLVIRKRVLGPEHPYTLGSMSNLAAVYEYEGKYAQAAGLDEQTLEIRKRVWGPKTLSRLKLYTTWLA